MREKKISGDVLIKIARDAIWQSFSGESLIDRRRLLGEYPYLAEDGAVFVTLTLEGRLRGCIGSTEAFRPLIDDIIHNAKASAFRDTRFKPLTKHEFKAVKIEISLLSRPQRVEYKSVEHLRGLLKPGVDGVILEKGFHRSVFLPQVWDLVSGFDAFFEHLCRKAGMSGDCLRRHPDIDKFQVQIFEEQ